MTKINHLSKCPLLSKYNLYMITICILIYHIDIKVLDTLEKWCQFCSKCLNDIEVMRNFMCPNFLTPFWTHHVSKKRVCVQTEMVKFVDTSFRVVLG